MSEPRAKLTLKTRLASALCQLVRYDDESAEFVRVIPHEQAKRMTEDEILATVDWHHFPIPKAHGGPDVHWNLTPLPRAEHKTITNKIDLPRIAKGKRLSNSLAAHHAVMQSKEPGQKRERRGTIPCRPFSEQHRPLKSRNSFQRRAP